MASNASSRKASSPQLSWPALVILIALAVLGAVTLVQWVLKAFAWLITFAVLMAVLVALSFWVARSKRGR